MGRKWFLIVCVLAFITSQKTTGQVEGAALSGGKALSPINLQQEDCLNLTAPVLTGPADGIVVLLDPETGQIAGDTKLQWTAVEGVQRYFLQTERDGSGMAPGSTYASTNEIPISEVLIDPMSVPLGWYHWRVAALDLTDGCPYLGPYSEFRSFRVVDNQVFKPVDLEASDGTFADRVVLTWDLDLSSGQVLPDYFRVLRNEYESLELVEIDSHLPADTRSFADITAHPNEKYSYRVIAASAANGEVESSIVEGWSARCVPVDPPQLVRPKNGAVFWTTTEYTNENWLYWTRPLGTYLYQYQVYDSAGELLVDKTIENHGVTIPFMYADDTFQWRVRSFSPVENCDPGPWSEFSTYTIKHLNTYPITDLQASQGTFSDRVLITWGLDENTREGFSLPERFRIMRANEPGGPKTELASISDISIRSYEDRTAQPGHHYTYWVISYSETLWNDEPADPVEGWAGAAQILQPVIFLPFVKR